jgi:hypothetical protein
MIEKFSSQKQDCYTTDKIQSCRLDYECTDSLAEKFVE